MCGPNNLGPAAIERKRKDMAQIRGKQNPVMSAHDSAFDICMFVLT